MEKHKKETIISAAALSLVALAWGTSYAIVKDTLSSIKPFSLMMLRFTLSTVFLSLIFSKKLKKISKRNIYTGSVIGIFMFLAFLTLVSGISYTTASKQSFLVGSYVLMVPFLSWAVSKKRPDLYSISGALLAVCGIGLLTLNKNLSINIGDIISIFCSFFFACHMIAIEYFSRETDPIISTIIQFAVTSLIFIILTGVFESFDFNLSSKTIKSVLYLVIVTTVIPFTVQNAVQKHLSSSSTALIFTLESAFGGLFSVFFLKETLTLRMLFGCIIIFIGIILGETKFQFIRGLFKKAEKCQASE